ncbi:MAG: hypothetical protein GF398_20330 [Chitinivibrionales bacterium]|nr:hypothetical protein [Chitinivibrionales bacterium]
MKETVLPNDLFISPQGDDTLSGTSPEISGNDGPVRTLERARSILRMRKYRGEMLGPTTVWLRGGRYQLDRPFVLTHKDSGPVTFAAYRDEQPVLSGGINVGNWEETRVEGKSMWTADVSGILKKFGPFRQLFVNGRRCERPRLPKQGYYKIKEIPISPVETNPHKVKDRFVCEQGHIQNWRNLQDVEIVVLHYWVDDRMPVERFDESTNLVTCSKPSRMSFVDGAGAGNSRYYVENVFEALSEPGEWYLDKQECRLYYLPRTGEVRNSCECIITVIPQLVLLKGDAAQHKRVEFLTFRGVHFEHTDWVQPFTTRQAAPVVPGVYSMQSAHNCTVEKCTFQRIGWYAIDMLEGCHGNRIIGNTLRDMGGGGIKINGADAWQPVEKQTGGNVITDNHIYDGGKVYYTSAGIAVMHSHSNTIAHNHIHDLFYTGISLGWVWGYWPSVTRDNIVEKNHIHDLGKGVINDMGGIYTLGIQPGTVVRNNLIHDIEKHSYGGWAVYLDEGSSYIVVENNICYNCSSQPFHLHFGRENILRNNIWAFGREGTIAISRGVRCRWEEKGAFDDGRGGKSLTFERNIVITDGQPAFVGAMDDPTGGLETKSIFSDLNLFWDVNGQSIFHVNAGHGAVGREGAQKVFEWDAWVAAGNDRHSHIGDPGCRDIAGRKFELASNSPACEIGFERFDMSDVGVREENLL